MSKNSLGKKRYLPPVMAALMAVLACGPLDIVREIAADAFRVYYVAPDGNDSASNDCRSWEEACLTIRAAARRVNAGDTIRVAAGTISIPDVTIDKIVSIEGMGEAVTTLELGTDGILIVDSDVTIRDLTITTYEPPTVAFPCLNVFAGNSITVTQVTLRDCAIGINISVDAEATLENVTVSGSSSDAIWNDGGAVTIRQSHLVENQERVIGNTGTMIIENTTIDRNGPNPGMSAGTTTFTTITNANSGHMELINSTISRSADTSNIGDRAIDNYGELILRNSTVSSNRGENAIIGHDGELRLQHVTVADNVGGGITIYGGMLEIENTILSGNGNDYYRHPSTPIPSHLGVNLCEDCAYFTTGELLLPPLADNGGPTETHALQLGSAAIDAATLDCPQSDQRGVGRPFGEACDVGAYEFDPTVDAESIALQEPATFTTVTPTADSSQVKALKDDLCWRGPGADYPVVSSVSAGTSLALLGVDSENNWLIVDSPRFPGVNCWLERDSADLSPEISLSALPVFPIPPLPTATPKPVKAAGCLVQDPKDPKQVICVPRACTPNDVPGGSCNP